ncbi:hypothetical protein [Haliovirga abyssi]|uniref:Uncharacterized protein n=1 Tax=Haliovirga abyssi TaxID=2996794 RepID=A0AAU9DAL9_9FUSO|nr:hypothetical protein [Haliovirga abyssi]BDU51693.1 hypothetical protein HLVA_22620 [Haliovirga abyssi]
MRKVLIGIIMVMVGIVSFGGEVMENLVINNELDLTRSKITPLDFTPRGDTHTWRLTTYGNEYGKRFDFIFSESVTMKSLNVLTLRENGNVGIGTSNPSEKLEVNGNIKLNGEYKKLIFKDNSNLAGDSYITGDDGYSKKLFLYHSRFIRLSNVRDQESGLTLMDSKVGIGVERPKRILHIKKKGSVDVLLEADGAGAFARHMFKTKDNGYGWNVGMRSDAGMDGGYSIEGNYNGWRSRLFIKRSGEVGIGTTTPSAKLDVNGNAKIKGTLTTNEIIVTQTIAATDLRLSETPWADFVFEDNYKLRTLNEVAKFVKVNKHLPDIPSEKEVKSKGVSVGDMQAKLLQKIEELTLYMIEQDKKNIEQTKEINMLKNKIKNLERR